MALGSCAKPNSRTGEQTGHYFVASK